jgi:peptidoglycan/xylan/chitin deacetylase (PgdA/CDA1 family)/folate-dependent phosphoribosylglycinamide formyltransferase PurN
MSEKELKVVFLVGSDSPSTRAAIESVCRLPHVRPGAVFLDTLSASPTTRFRNLRRNIRKEGYSYVFRRGVNALVLATGALMDRSSRRAEARSILVRAFPDMTFTLKDLCHKFDMPLIAAGDLNSREAAEDIRRTNPDLGIVLGTRILKRPAFSAPRLGSINLHKGAVPDYRGTPPGFWEIYNKETSAGVTVHYVDEGLDTGDIVATGQVEISPLDTPETLLVKLHRAGTETLATAVRAIQSGDAKPVKQESGIRKAYSRPTYKEVAELRRRLPHWNRPSPLPTLVKNLYVLAVYHSGLFSLVKWWHGRAKTRAAIILYHRVNDVSRDALTAGTEEFAAQISLINRLYKPIATRDLVDRLCAGESIPGTSVAIHFDDCYRDVFTCASPVLRALNVPATAFVNSAFVGTNRSFSHDVTKSPFRFDNFTVEDLRALLETGFEIGAHTANHVDLGTCPIEEARREIDECVDDLNRMTGREITLFSYPFGKERNIRKEVVPFIAERCECMFSAFGGFVGPGTDLFDIPRFGVSGMHHPLYVALEIEGLAPNVIKKRIRSWFTRSKEPRRSEVPA